MFDVSCALVGLLITAPLMLAVAMAVKLTSPGPILYRQRRLGMGERPFQIWKFRSMRVDAERTGPQFTTAGDPRITRVGRIIRKTSLDELPQLFNILRGEMSVFGPRPCVGFELEHWTSEQRRHRAAVRPGLSGISQTSGRSALGGEEKIRADLQYVQQCSLLLDLKLVVRTLLSVLADRGVN